jgi:hypothetical protein
LRRVGRVTFWTVALALIGEVRSLLKACWTTLLAKARDATVMRAGSLLPRLSHHRNGLSTQPPSVLGTLPS